LEKSVRVIKKILEFVTVRTKRFCGKLRGHFDASHGRIFRDVADFIHLNAGFSG
jgi:hypothetical protein